MKLLFAFLLLAVTALADSGWKAGAAKVVITPREPIWMAGYASRNKPAEGTAQELYAKALALEDAAGQRAIIITLDLIGVPRPLRERLATRLRDARQFPAEGLLLNASHTHCGPELRVASKPGIFVEIGRAEQAEAYGNALEEQLFQLSLLALDKLQPATLTWHRARCGFAMNRRLPTDAGYRNSPYPDGPVDQEVPVLRITSAGPKGVELALLFGYACHNTTLSFYQWCGDYAGFAQEAIEAAHPGAIALFVQGCGADQNPYPRGKIEHAQIHGRALASAVDAALGTPATAIEGPLKVAQADVPLAFAPQPDRAGFEARVNGADKSFVPHAKRMLAHLDNVGPLPTTYAFPVQVLRFGRGLTFIGLGGETTVDYSLRLKRELAGTAVWVAGYSNDVMGYIPSKRVLLEGGYEAGDSMKYGSLPFPWLDTLEETIIAQVHALLKKTAP